MIFRSKRDILRDQKVHYKMPKLKKRWLVTGLTALGLSLGISIPAMQVQAESQPVKTVDKKAMPAPQKPKAAIAPSNLVSGGASKDYFSGISENYSTAAPFSEVYHNQTLSSVPQKTGYIKAGSDQTGALRLMYFHGTNANSELTSQIGTGWRKDGSFPYGYNQGEVANAISGSDPSPKYPIFMTPNFAIRRGDGKVWGWLFSNGNGCSSSPFLAGINNDWNTADMGSNWRFWSMEQSPTENGLNSVITLKFTGDFTFRTNHTYTLDFTMTLKPNGSNVNYTLAIRNVTSLVNPAMSQADAELPDFWFGSQFDTMLGKGPQSEWVDGKNPDYVPIYYIGENQGLYLNYGGYKLSFNFTSKNAPTGWGAANWQSTSFAAAGISKPTSLGQNGNNGKKDTVAFQAGDSALHMVWTGKNLAVGDTREANYQVSISSNSAVLPEIELNRMTDNYSGGAYKVEGKVTNPAKGHLDYYYQIDDNDPISFEGPQNVGDDPQPFNFTIPSGKMVVGDNHQISVYAIDENGSSSKTKYLRLTAKAELKTVDKTYYTGEEFDQFANFAGGLSVTMQPLTKDKITNTVIKKDNAASEEVPVTNWNQITANPGEYTITYTYKYGSGPEATPENSISKEAKIKVIDRRRITLKYVDQKGKAIDERLLNNLPEGMKSGPHERPYGSKFPLVKTKELFLDGKKYYDFVKFENLSTTAPEIIGDELIFGDYDQEINVVYQGAKVQLTIHHELKKPDGSTVPIPDMGDQSLDGVIGESTTIEPTPPKPGYVLAAGQSSQPWTFKPGENNEITFYYTANPQENITVHFVNLNTGKDVLPAYTPKGHATGDELDLSEQNQELITKIPEGYHYASAADLKDKKDENGQDLKQPGKLKYTSEAQNPKVYVAAESQNNITVKFVNAKNGAEVDTQTPAGHTGEELNLTADSNYIRTAMPKGYRYAEATELPKGTTQPGKLTYKTTPQTAIVYVMGQPTDASSRVTVHHYLEGTTTNVPGKSDTYVDGYIGDTTTISKNDPDQKAPEGYTIAETPQSYTWEFKADTPKEVIFYYKGNSQNNITVKFIRLEDGKEILPSYIPQGHKTGDELDLTDHNQEIIANIPKGYRYATDDELRNKGITRPGNPQYTTSAQTATVYVVPKPAEEPIEVELINIKDPKDKIPDTNAPTGSTTVDPVSGHLVYKLDPRDRTIFPNTPKVDDPVTLTDYIEKYNDPTSSTPRTTLMLPKGYTIPEEKELKSLGLAQGEPRFGAEVVVRSKFYVAKAKTKQQFSIDHVCINSDGLKLRKTNGVVDDNGNFTIDTNNFQHRPPYGYKIIGATWDTSKRIDRSIAYDVRTGLITGKFPERGNTLTILYRKF